MSDKKITRREFNKKVGGALAGAAAISSGAFSLKKIMGESLSKKKPNFVFVCSDQHSGRFTTFGGNTSLKTPNMDKIAKKGVVFTSAYTGSPLCAPGRASMMTGMYSSDLNSFCNTTVYDGSHPTWSKRLRDFGYYTWGQGKMDLNDKYDLGFEGKISNGHSKNPDISSLFRRPVGYRVNESWSYIDGGVRKQTDNESKTVERFGHILQDIETTNQTVKFITEETLKLNKPFVIYAGLTQPHPRWFALERYFNYYLSKVEAPKVTEKELEQMPLPYQILRNFRLFSIPTPEKEMKRARAAYFGNISELDEHVGEIYNALEKTNQIDNTYLIYTSDHGECLGTHGLWLKDNLYEEAVNVPLIISGPGLPMGKVIDKPISHVDLVATMLELSGMKKPNELRGKSLLSLINGNPDEGPQSVYSECNCEGNPTGSYMIRKDDWKLIHFSYYDNYLFNLKDDPGELRNRIHDPSVKDLVKELQKTLYDKVDPEEVTQRSFETQDKYLQAFRDKLDEEGLFELFRSRLGEGESRVLAKKLNRKG